LTKSKNVERLTIKDRSGNGNYLTEIGSGNIDYDAETSMIFDSPNKKLCRRMNMLTGNINSTIVLDAL
jgi:hypothetical protein